MKRYILALLLALALVVGVAVAEQVAMRIVTCPEQEFSTLCNPEYTYDFTPDGGLTLYLGEGEDDAFVTIFKTDAPGIDFDAEYYLNNVYVDLLKSTYGEDLIDIGGYAVYTLGGRQMPSRLSMYRQDGEERMRFCAYDLREDCFVRYEAFSGGRDEDMEDALRALAVAVGNFQPDADYYSGK